MAETTWTVGEEIRSQDRLEDILRALQEQALGEGLRYEVAVEKVRREAYERIRRDLALSEALG